MSDKLTAERLRALDDLDNRAETLSDKVLAGQDVRQYLYDHRAAILAMAEERDRMREAGGRLAFAAGALNIATDSAEHLTGERGNVLDALKGWKSALGKDQA